MKQHDLKTWPEPFDAIWNGVKRHEVRKDDRDFRVGDTLRLQEFLPKKEHFTGRCVMARVTYLTEPTTWGLPEGLCVMSISVLARCDTEDAYRRWKGLKPAQVAR